MSFSASESSALAQYVHVLYPLAQVLVGPKEADALLHRTYEQAAAVPPSDRPSNEREWLVRLLIDARNESPESDIPTSASDTTGTGDAFRRDIAEQVARDKLPVAFASCALRERLILTIDALTDTPDALLSTALDTTTAEAASLRDRAHSTLRASLRDVLTGPERMLFDMALPDDALRVHLHAFLTDRFQPTPPSIQSDVADILASNRVENDVSSRSLSLPTERLSEGTRLLRRWMNSYRGLAVLAVVALLFVVGLGNFSFFAPEPASSSTSVVDLSVRSAPDVAPTHPTTSPSEAAAYIQRTWNRQVAVPTITEASLQGVGHVPLSDSSTVPVLLYADDDSNHRIAAYAFNYALLDQSGNRAVLAPSLRTKLAAPDTLLARQHADHSAVLWRHRDDIFVVVAPHATTPPLRTRIQQ